MRTVRTLLALTFYLTFLAATGFAQRMPQDRWYLDSTIGGADSAHGTFGDIYSIAIASNEWIYVADSTIHVFTPDGVLTQEWPDSYSSDIAFGPDGMLYTLSGSSVRVFTPDGVLTNEWGSGLAGGLTVATNGLVYIADTADDRIRVFTSAGIAVTNWGESGTATHQLAYPTDVAVGADGMIYVSDAGTDSVKKFTPDGQFLEKIERGVSQYRIAASPDGLMAVTHTVSGDYLWLFHPESDFTLSLWMADFDPDGPGGVAQGAAVAFGRDGTMAVGTAASVYGKLWIFKRAYRTVGLPARNAPPLPVVYRAAQRPGTTIMDIDYAVQDTDSTNVAVAALAFVDGNNTLDDLLRMSTFADGTESNINCTISANEKKRLSWNVAADWSTELGQVKIEILARDRVGVLDVHYITIPSNGPDPELTISRSPVTDSDVLSYWYWLIATGDAAVNLVTGSVYGTTGGYSGKTLASGSTTTADGYAFIFEQMNVRQATTNEITRAREATTPGSVTTWAPRFTVGPGILPKKLNEYGFDTGFSASSRWIVPLP